MKLELTLDQLREIVFKTSYIFHDTLHRGASLQEAEIDRLTCLFECVEKMNLEKENNRCCGNCKD